MNKKVIITDLDGTVVHSPYQSLPTPALVHATRQLQQKYHVCSATGRVWSFAKPVLQALELTDPCIISAGTQICDPQTGEILWEKTIESQALQEVIRVVHRYPEAYLLYNDATEEDYFSGGMKSSDFSPSEPIYFLELVFVVPTLAKKIYQDLLQIDDITVIVVNSQKPNLKDIHVIHKGATKEHAVTKLLEMLSIDRNDAIAIGDGHNDIDLFKAVGKRVAMGNSVPELKAVADLVISSVDNDGLARYFEELLATN